MYAQGAGVVVKTVATLRINYVEVDPRTHDDYKFIHRTSGSRDWWRSTTVLALAPYARCAGFSPTSSAPRRNLYLHSRTKIREDP